MRSLPQARFRLAVVGLILLVAFPRTAMAECVQQLRSADESFREGRFAEVFAVLDDCRKAGPTRDELVQLHALEAKTRLAMDEVEAARESVEALLRLRPDYKPNTVSDSPRFVRLVDELRQESTTVQVSSVSKTPESLREAPATVVVITAEEIARRGYLDLEAILHDLPGFDISRTNGVFYSNLYQRGYRSDTTNRTPVFIDGVQENDLFTTTVHLSRQFPLINVERVEVIYGPASTMYGANAFAGVINVITKDPEKTLEPGRKLGAEVEVTGGSFGTGNIDAMLSGRIKNLSWSVSSRVFHSDEMDLSRFDDWDYDESFFDQFDYASSLNIDDGGAQQFLIDYEKARQACLKKPPEGGECPKKFPRTSDLYDFDDEGNILVTPEGEKKAAELDKLAYTNEFDDRLAGFEDPTEDWLLHAKLKLPNLDIGFQTWRREEGWAPWRTDRSSFGTRKWTPLQTWLYARYVRELSSELSLTFFARYKQHELDGGTNQVNLSNYSTALGSRLLDFGDLVNDRAASWQRLYFYQRSTQAIGELIAVYTPSERLSVVSGAELKSSSIQGSYTTSTQENPSETGSPGNFFRRGGTGDNNLGVEDAGLYSQASYRLKENLKLVFGGRVDHNEIRESEGFGTEFNPRLGAIYSRGDYVLKAIYSEAFQGPSNFDKFNERSDGSVVANPELTAEKARNFELSGSWQPKEDLSIDLVAYLARYDDVIRLVNVGPCDQESFPRCKGESRQFRASGALEIFGLQASFAMKWRNLDLYANYTFTDPTNTDPVDQDGKPIEGELRIGDIASHQLNFGVHARFRQRFDLDLRANYVGPRKTGAGTDIRNGLGTDIFVRDPDRPDLPVEIDSYFVAHASLRYRDLFRGADLQLIVNNLFDTEYYHPGIRGADGTIRPPRHPQNERAVYLRLSTAF